MCVVSRRWWRIDRRTTRADETRLCRWRCRYGTYGDCSYRVPVFVFYSGWFSILPPCFQFVGGYVSNVGMLNILGVSRTKEARDRRWRAQGGRRYYSWLGTLCFISYIYMFICEQKSSGASICLFVLIRLSSFQILHLFGVWCPRAHFCFRFRALGLVPVRRHERNHNRKSQRYLQRCVCLLFFIFSPTH